ncbi:MAG: hypothetical protein BM556_11130 [Bacteriovorax sp. MedPE-SWde]|nr:MAG: hypothetical protein BM556_11130 [Bacteriovorax sp. MedPE-SWde]
MAKQIKDKNSKQHGFTLIEVMIALAIFGVFIVSFMSGQGYNVTDSASLRRELQLKEYAQLKINELLVSPPELKESLTLRPETGKFEENEQFKFEVTYKRFKVPDYEKLKGNEESQEEDASSSLQKKIFETVKKNMEEMVWQIEVTVIDTTTDYRHSVSTWLTNEKIEVKLDTL